MTIGFQWRVRDSGREQVTYTDRIRSIVSGHIADDSDELTTDEFIEKIVEGRQEFYILSTYNSYRSRAGKAGIEPKRYMIIPPRLDLLAKVVAYAKSKKFSIRHKKDRLNDDINMLHVKRGVKIELKKDSITISVRKGRVYRAIGGGFSVEHFIDDKIPDALRSLLDDAKGDALQRDDLIQNMVAIEVRDILKARFTNAKFKMNKARKEDEPAILSTMGSFNCFLDNSVAFGRIDGQHHGTFSVTIDLKEGLSVFSQLGKEFKVPLTLESPEYTPENIAAWVLRCAEYDLEIAKLKRIFKNQQKAMRKDLSDFVKK